MATNATAPYMAAARQGGQILYSKPASDKGVPVGTGTGIRGWFVRKRMGMSNYFSKPSNQTLQKFQQQRNAELRRMFRRALEEDYKRILTEKDVQDLVRPKDTPLTAREVINAIQGANDHLRKFNFKYFDQLVNYINSWTIGNLDNNNSSVLSSKLSEVFKTFNIELPNTNIPNNKAAVQLFINIANELCKEATSSSQKIPSFQHFIEASAERFKSHLAAVARHISTLPEDQPVQRSFLQKILLHPSMANIPAAERALAMQLLTHRYRTEILPEWDSVENEPLGKMAESEETPLDPNEVFSLFFPKKIDRTFLKVDESNLVHALYRASAENRIRQQKAQRLEGLQKTLFLALTTPEWSRRPASLDDFERYTELLVQHIETITRDYENNRDDENHEDLVGKPVLSMRRVWKIIAGTEIPPSVNDSNFAARLVNHPFHKPVRRLPKDASLFRQIAIPKAEQPFIPIVMPSHVVRQPVQPLDEGEQPPLPSHENPSVAQGPVPGPSNPRDLPLDAITQTTDPNPNPKSTPLIGEPTAIGRPTGDHSNDDLEHRENANSIHLTPPPQQHTVTEEPVEKPVNAQHLQDDTTPRTPPTRMVKSSGRTYEAWQSPPIDWIPLTTKFSLYQPISFRQEECTIVPVIERTEGTATYTIPISQNFSLSNLIDDLHYTEVIQDGQTCYILCVLAALLNKDWGRDFLKGLCQISSIPKDRITHSQEAQHLSIRLKLKPSNTPNSCQFTYDRHDKKLLIPLFESVVAAHLQKDRSEWGNPQAVLESLGLDFVSLIESQEIAAELHRSLALGQLSAKSQSEFSQDVNFNIRYMKKALLSQANSLHFGTNEEKQNLSTEVQYLYNKMFARLFGDSEQSPLLTGERSRLCTQTTEEFLEKQVQPAIHQFYTSLLASAQKAQGEQNPFAALKNESQKTLMLLLNIQAKKRDENFISSCIADIITFITDEFILLEYDNDEQHIKNIKKLNETIKDIINNNQDIFFGHKNVLKPDTINLLCDNISTYLKKQRSISFDTQKELNVIINKFLRKTKIKTGLKKRCQANRKTWIQKIRRSDQEHSYNQFQQLYLSNLAFLHANILLSKLNQPTRDFYQSIKHLYIDEFNILSSNFTNITGTKLQNFMSTAIRTDSPMLIFRKNHWMPLIRILRDKLICHSMQGDSTKRNLSKVKFIEDMRLLSAQGYENAAGTPVDIIQIKKPQMDIEKEK
ncbi:hypothetical protein [Desulfatiglans anilini]|uniref:hypothetical protein n=1 Tax=Desulfatiglans anilini TaxID=90728 RepID=UPI000421A7A3|nr:hypothetical protein [Desulfatiglans anilini]